MLIMGNVYAVLWMWKKKCIFLL